MHFSEIIAIFNLQKKLFLKNVLLPPFLFWTSAFLAKIFFLLKVPKNIFDLVGMVHKKSEFLGPSRDVQNVMICAVAKGGSIL